MSTTPDVITRYLKAAEKGDVDTLVACFTDDGAVLDEGRSFRGRDQIRGWREDLQSKWEFTRTVTGSESAGESQHVVTMHLEGNFPGGSADLTYRFTLAGGQIADLTIR